MKNPDLPKRVLLVTPYTVPDFSGSGLNAFYFARFLNQGNLRATILTFNRNLRMKGKELIDGVPILRIPYFNRNLLTKILSLSIILPSYIIQIMKTRVVFIYGAHIIGYQVIIILAKLMGKKVIFRSLLLGSDDAATLFRNKSKLSYSFYRKMFRQLDLYFSINPVFEERFRTLMGPAPKILTCPQGVDTEIFKQTDEIGRNQLRDKYGMERGTFIILSVGFLINRKGFREVFTTLGEMPYDFRYFVIGEHTFPQGHFLSAKMEEARMIRKEGISELGEKLILTGPVNDVADYYQMADLILINSTREGLPNTLLEAMACGNAVLIRDLPGISFIIEHLKSGIIYQDKDQMSKWLVRLYREPALRSELGREARNFVKGSATFNLAWDKILACIKD